MLQKLTGLKASISTYQSLVSQQEDLQTLWELANEEQDEDLEPEIEQAGPFWLGGIFCFCSGALMVRVKAIYTATMRAERMTSAL